MIILVCLSQKLLHRLYFLQYTHISLFRGFTQGFGHSAFSIEKLQCALRDHGFRKPVSRTLLPHALEG